MFYLSLITKTTLKKKITYSLLSRPPITSGPNTEYKKY